MGPLVLVILVAVIAYTWMRGAKQNRIRWLERLDLPGTWELQGAEGTLELSGELSGGQYRLRESNSGELVDERGHWRLEGHSLTLEPRNGAALDYDLRLFKEGTIGIDGHGRKRRIYQKNPSNVVPLHRSQR